MKAQYFALIGTNAADVENIVECTTERQAWDIQTNGIIETEKLVTALDVAYMMEQQSA